jgi:tRNA-dihydrouridine synthase
MKKRAAVKIPFTVKFRAGWNDQEIVCVELAKMAEACGLCAVALHARTREQGYSGQARWEWIAAVKQATALPVIGNGDIFTWRDAKRRMEETGCSAVMVGRWALAKPWMFREFAEQRDIELSPEERLAVVSRYVELCRAYFRDDEKGRSRTRRFLVFHQDFFRRYRRNAAAFSLNTIGKMGM